MTIKQTAIGALKQQLEELHDASEHAYQDNPLFPGSCAICGWFHPNGPKLGCGHTLRQHAEMALKELENSDEEVTPAIVVEVTVVGVSDLPFGRDPWWNWGI